MSRKFSTSVVGWMRTIAAFIVALFLLGLLLLGILTVVATISGGPVVDASTVLLPEVGAAASVGGGGP